MRVVCIDLIETSSESNFVLQNLAEVFFRYTPQISIGTRSVFLEVGACRRLYSEESFLVRLKIILKKMAVQARIGMGDNPAVALAFARYPGSNQLQLPIAALTFFMNPFCESTSLDKMLTLLQYLGIQTLGDLLKIPKDQLTSRMGREVVLARHYIDAANVLPWPRFYLQEKIIERFEVADLCAIQNLEPMLFALKQILDRVTLRLRGRGQLIVSFQLRVFQDRYSTTKKYKRSWDFALSFPVHSTRDLLTILRERLSSSLQREPLDSAIRELEFEVVQAVAFAGRQTHFFSKKEEELEGFQSIVARLAERLGSGRVFMAKPIESYVAERCWQKSEVGFVDLESVGLRMSAKPVAEAAPGHAAVHAHGRATGYAYAPVPIRPLRILRNPQILRKIENQMIHPSRRWQIVRWLGPERISGEWWLGDQERDYFRALTDTGEELWIFKNTENIDSEYYLHGIFD